MSLKWIIQVLVQYEILVITSPSITGVTYMDHFDFEERYRDANECNPLYWHPLHLPPYCAEVFEKLIRSRLASNTPVKIMRKREKNKHRHPTYSYPEEIYNFPYPIYQMSSEEYEAYSQPLSPYEEVVELLRKDIEKDPSAPTVTVMPNLGPVALYKQGISKKSEKRIKAMAEAYVKATKKMYEEYYAAYVKPNQHPGPYHTIAQMAESVVKAMAEGYVAESRKKHAEYMAAYEKYEKDKKKHINKKYTNPRDAVKIIKMKNWANL